MVADLGGLRVADLGFGGGILGSGFRVFDLAFLVRDV